MSLHPHAWRGQNIVILDENLSKGLSLEQAIAAVSPANEVIIETFADYAEAYDYCREKANVGLILISSNLKIPIADAVEQMSRYYQFYGTSPRAVIILDSEANELETYRIRAQEPRCFRNIKRSEIENSLTAVECLNDLWKHYQSSIESEYFPHALQNAFLSGVADKLQKESLNFQERVSSILGSELNLSWFDQIAVKWAPVLNEVNHSNCQMLKSSEFIINLSALASYGKIDNAAEFAKDKSAPLAKRLATVIAQLDEQRMKGALPLAIASYAKLAKPGSPALYRLILKKADQIISIAGLGNISSQNSDIKRRVG